MPETRFLFAILLILSAVAVHAQSESDTDRTPTRINPSTVINTIAEAGAENTEGNRLFRASQYIDSEAHFRKAIALRPDFYEAHYNLGVLYVDTKRYREAINAFESAEALNGASPRLHQLLGYAYERLKRSKLAIAQYEKEIELQPSATAYTNLGFLYANQLRFDEAGKSFREALSLQPTFEQATYGLCLVYVTEKRAHDAIPLCQQMAADTDSAVGKFLLGTAYLDNNQFSEAVTWLREAQRLEPNDPRVVLTLGEANFKSGRYDAALKNFEQIAARDSNSQLAIIGLGAAYFGLRKYSEAQQAFNRAIALNPESSTAHYNLGLTCLQARRRDCALEQYDILKSLSPDLSNALFASLFGDRVISARNVHQNRNQ